MKELVHPCSVEYRALRRSSPSPEVYAHADGEVKSMAINPPFQVVVTERPGEAALNEALNHTDEVYGGPRSQSVENTKWTHCLYMVSPEPKHCT